MTTPQELADALRDPNADPVKVWDIWKRLDTRTPLRVACDRSPWMQELRQQQDDSRELKS